MFWYSSIGTLKISFGNIFLVQSITPRSIIITTYFYKIFVLPAFLIDMKPIRYIQRSREKIICIKIRMQGEKKRLYKSSFLKNNMLGILVM